jgi:hypothetical protein
VIENEDEERRGTNIPREVDEGEVMNVVESQSPQFIALVDIDLRLSDLKCRC